MKYRYLGRSGLLVSRICLGTMTFGMANWGCDQKQASRIVNSFVEAGGNFLDTADMYSAGVSEEMTGKAINDHNRDELIIATKAWFRTSEGANGNGSSRKHILGAVEASLRRLGTDYIDLYQVHGPDWFTPMEETMRTLDDLVRQGKVRYIGCSNYYAWQMVKANAVAEKMNLEKFISAQHMYNLVRRDIEREILPACADQGLGMLCWSPLASGFLSGKYQRGKDVPDGSRISFRKSVDIPRYFHDYAFDTVETLVELGEVTGKPPSQLSTAWLLGDRRVTSIISGPKTVEQIEDVLAVADWNLEQEHWDQLEKVSNFQHGYPLEWIDQSYGNIGGMEEFAPGHHRLVLDRS
jgi:aryl-alcohol dehydrogenase-like predicted oxidoreductase